jgi:hypothetical protein
MLDCKKIVPLHASACAVGGYGILCENKLYRYPPPRVQSELSTGMEFFVITCKNFPVQVVILRRNGATVTRIELASPHWQGSETIFANELELARGSRAKDAKIARAGCILSSIQVLSL